MAIAQFKDDPHIDDSLMQVYQQRWAISVVYGQHFITGANRVSPDTVTFADFTSRRVFYGLEVSYFINARWQLSLGGNILLFPPNREINSITTGSNGIQIEGKGSGGAFINLGLGAKYFLKHQAFTRPYVGIKLGGIRATAKGASGSFSFGQSSAQEVKERQTSYSYAQLSAGFAHRMAPGFMVDFNLGYTQTSQSANIGGVTSPGGISVAFSLQFILNARKK